jgi:hypothetical protein
MIYYDTVENRVYEELPDRLRNTLKPTPSHLDIVTLTDTTPATKEWENLGSWNDPDFNNKEISREINSLSLDAYKEQKTREAKRKAQEIIFAQYPDFKQRNITMKRAAGLVSTAFDDMKAFIDAVRKVENDYTGGHGARTTHQEVKDDFDALNWGVET